MAGHSASTSSAAGPSRPRRHNGQSTSVGTNSTMGDFGGSSFPQFDYIGHPSNIPQEFFWHDVEVPDNSEIPYVG